MILLLVVVFFPLNKPVTPDYKKEIKKKYQTAKFDEAFRGNFICSVTA